MGKMLGSVYKEGIFSLALFLVVFQVMGLGSSIEWRIIVRSLGQHFVPALVFYLEVWVLSSG